MSFIPLMRRETRQPPSTKFISAVAICLAFGGFFIASCERPPGADPSESSSQSAADTTVPGAILRADPNPVPPGSGKGLTTITWDTGSDAVGEVYVFSEGNEKLFASGRQGSQQAAWIQPGSTEFRLYTETDRKLLAQLTVTMPAADSSKKPAASP